MHDEICRLAQRQAAIGSVQQAKRLPSHGFCPQYHPLAPQPGPAGAVHIMLALFWFPPLNTKGIPLPGWTIMDLGERPFVLTLLCIHF